MRDLTKSTLSYTWAMSLFGVQQAANLLAPPDRSEPTRKANGAFFSVKQSAENQFGDLAFAAFLVGDGVQRGLTNLFFDGLTLRVLDPRYVSNLTSQVAAQAQDTLRTYTAPDSLRLAWQMLRNNYEVFNLVKNVSSLLHISDADQQLDLRRLVEEAYALGAYPDLWAVEGLGHVYAAAFMSRGGPVRGLLTDERASVLPAKSLTMMHAGIGLGFAQPLLQTVTPYSDAQVVRATLQRFVTLVDENSRPGYEGAAYESLGLVTRFWHAEMVPIVDAHLREFAPHTVGYFWHGAGRSLYFNPLYFVPGLLSPWLQIEREAPDEFAYLNMNSGLAWATTIVNVRQPEIMENFLRVQGERAARTGAFANGLQSTLIMGIDITPDDVYIKNFLEHRPNAADRRTAALWEALVARPGREAVYHIHPVLQRHERLGEVFHYHPSLAELAARLESERGRERGAAR